jgi:hypothetical protein
MQMFSWRGSLLAVLAIAGLANGRASADAPILTGVGTFTAPNSVPAACSNLSTQGTATFYVTGTPGPVDAWAGNDPSQMTTPLVIQTLAGVTQAQPFTPTANQTYIITPAVTGYVEIAPDSSWASQTSTANIRCSSQVAQNTVINSLLSTPPYTHTPLMAYGPWVAGASANNLTTLNAAIAAADNTALGTGGKVCIDFPSAAVDPIVNGDVEVPAGVGFCGIGWNSEYQQKGILKFDSQTFANNISIVLAGGPGGATDAGHSYANLDRFLNVRWAWACCSSTASTISSPVNCQQPDVQFINNMWIIEENTTAQVTALKVCGSDTIIANPIFKDVNTGSNQSFQITDNASFPASAISLTGGYEYGTGWGVASTVANVSSGLTQVTVAGNNFQLNPVTTALDSTSCVCYNNFGLGAVSGASLTGIRAPQVLQTQPFQGATVSHTASLPNSATAGNLILAIVTDLQSSAVTTPTGYTLLGTACGLSSFGQIQVYYRTATGNASDQFAFSQANATAYALFVSELANAGTPTNFNCTTQSATLNWQNTQISVTANSLVFGLYTMLSSTPTTILPDMPGMIGWNNSAYQTGALGNALLFQTIGAQYAAKYAPQMNWGTNESGVSVDFSIPAAQ